MEMKSSFHTPATLPLKTEAPSTHWLVVSASLISDLDTLKCIKMFLHLSEIEPRSLSNPSPSQYKL